MRYQIGILKMNKEDKAKYLKEIIELCDNIEDQHIESILLARKLRNDKLNELENLEND